MNTTIDETPADQPIIIVSRTFDAARDVLWRVCTDPALVKRWFLGGDDGATCEMDVRPGGIWRISSRGHEKQFEYVDVVQGEKLAWKAADSAAHPGPQVTVTFETVPEGTKWRAVARFGAIQARDQAVQMGYPRVLIQGAEGIARLLETLKTS